jgi:hypothetical protein
MHRRRRLWKMRQSERVFTEGRLLNKCILGLDPGSALSSFVVWDGEVVLQRGEMKNEDLRNLILSHSIIADECGIETMVYGKRFGREIADTMLWAGRFAECWAQTVGTEPAFLPRPKVRKYFCPIGGNDAMVRKAIIDAYGKPGSRNKQGPLYGVTRHLWQALAVAIYLHVRCLKELKQQNKEGASR